MRVLKANFFTAVILCFSCDEDDYNKDNFRCVINRKRLSVADDEVRIFDKYPPTYIRWVDSTVSHYLYMVNCEVILMKYIR